jgi:methylated-DNA-[protein]-cysteine S-methyltransferase
MTKEPNSLQLERIASPIGDLLVACLGEAVCAIEFDPRAAEVEPYLARRFPECARRRGGVPTRVRAALARYFDGDMAAFDGIESGARGTPFQERLWAALRKIPAGQTRTYAEMAARIGRPTAVRAVGHANGRNPVSIMVPCHRVIGSDGALTGFGGGLARKAWLLHHEGARGPSL